jgi:hypothetical protein
VTFPLLHLGEKPVNALEIAKFPLLQLGEKPVNALEITKFPLLQLGERVLQHTCTWNGLSRAHST